MSGPRKLGGGAGVAMPLPGGPFKKKNEKKIFFLKVCLLISWVCLGRFSLYLKCGLLRVEGKLGTIWIRHHGAIYVWKSWLCCSCQYTHSVCTHPVFLGCATHYHVTYEYDWGIWWRQSLYTSRPWDLKPLNYLHKVYLKSRWKKNYRDIHHNHPGIVSTRMKFTQKVDHFTVFKSFHSTSFCSQKLAF